MKKISLLFIIILFGLNAIAQDTGNEKEYKTLIGGENITHGGYGGVSINYSKIDGEDAILVGVRGGWIINHGISIGVGGYGFANDIDYNKTIEGDEDINYDFAGGYGGLIIEPIIGAKWPVHISFPIMIGAGGVSYNNDYWTDDDDPCTYYNYTEDSDAFLVIEPGLEIELNMVKFMRLALGGYYRHTSNIDIVDTKSDMLNGFSCGITLKFGKF